MSLGGMSKGLNSAGDKAFNDARGRMLREKEAQEKLLHSRMLDRERQEVSHRKLEHQRIITQIQNLKRNLILLKRSVSDTNSLDRVRSTEAQLRAFESEARMIDQDIRTKTLEIQRSGGKSF